MKAIMISIRPEWTLKILNKEKILEIRTSCPKEWRDYLSGKTKIKPQPTKCYIYCTKGKKLYKCVSNFDEDLINGKVIAEFTLNKVDDFSKWEYDFGALIRSLDLYAGTEGNYPFLIEYLNGQCKGYGWHIDNLKIYDKPKELSEFSTTLHRMKGKQTRYTSHLLQRPPQSWCYVEVLKEA